MVRLNRMEGMERELMTNLASLQLKSGSGSMTATVKGIDGEALPLTLSTEIQYPIGKELMAAVGPTAKDPGNDGLSGTIATKTIGLPTPFADSSLPNDSQPALFRLSALLAQAAAWASASGLDDDADSGTAAATPTASSMSIDKLSSPNPILRHVLTRQLAVGILGFELPRIIMALNTWGRYVRPDALFFYADRVAPTMPQVINLKHPRPNVSVTDRRGSAWKVLPALEHMLNTAPSEVLWFYLADDDSFPISHMLAQVWLDHSHRSEVYAGEATAQNTYMKAYYKDEEESGLVGRKLNIRYMCTGGGVLMSRALLERVVPLLEECPVFFASDVSLGHCIQKVAGVKKIHPIASIHHMYPRTPEESMKKFRMAEYKLQQAASFHHMKPPFIYKDGVSKSVSATRYLIQTEQRFFAGFIAGVAMMRRRMESEEEAHAQVMWRLTNDQPTMECLAKSNIFGKQIEMSVGPVPMIRLAIVHAYDGATEKAAKMFAESSSTGNSGSGYTGLQARLFALLFNSTSSFSSSSSEQSLAFGAGFFASHAFHTDYIALSPPSGCTPCVQYEPRSSTSKESSAGETESCMDKATVRVWEMFERHPYTMAKRAIDEAVQSDASKDTGAGPMAITSVDWSAYDIVIATDDVLPASTVRDKYASTTVFMHTVSKQCRTAAEQQSNRATPTTTTTTSSSSTPSLKLVDAFGTVELPDTSPTDHPVLPFPLTTPSHFTFYGLTQLLLGENLFIPRDLSSPAFSGATLLLDEAATMLLQTKNDDAGDGASSSSTDSHSQTRATKKLAVSLGIIPSINATMAQVPFGARIDLMSSASSLGHAAAGMETKTSARARRLKQYMESTLCLFGAGMTKGSDSEEQEGGDKGSKGSDEIAAPLPADEESAAALEGEIMLAISAGCHTFFSSKLVSIRPHLAAFHPLTAAAATSDSSSASSSSTTTAQLAHSITSLSDFISYARRLLHDPDEPYSQRRLWIESGSQRMQLNRLNMDRPLYTLIHGAAKQLQRQKERTKDDASAAAATGAAARR